MPHFDQGTWLAYRTKTAQEMGPPKLPAHVALPGAKAAISHEHLLAHHDTGKSEHEIVQRVNAKWAQAHAEQTAEHARWVAGPYAEALMEMRHRADEKAAEEMRQRVLFNEILRERGDRARDAETSR